MARYNRRRTNKNRRRYSRYNKNRRSRRYY